MTAEWRPGANVARYSLLAKIATGGMAEIWLADQGGLQGFKKLVVIKRILETYSKNPDFVSMFLDEARIAAQLNHPNVVQIFDLGEHGGAYYIAMEYLPGENLSAVVRTGLKKNQPLPVPLAAKLLSGAAAGLGHARRRQAPAIFTPGRCALRSEWIGPRTPSHLKANYPEDALHIDC